MAKGIVGLLAGVPSKGGTPAAPKGEDTSPKRMAAQDMIDALETGDAEALETAFTRMYKACAADHGSEVEYDVEDEASLTA